MQIVVTISGDKKQIERLQKMGQSFLKFRPEMEKIGKMVADYAQGEGTTSQGGVFDARWPRLSPRYAAWKAKHYPGRPPLVRSTNMSRKYKYKADETSVTITNGADYFKFHQTGTTHMPQRLTLAVNAIQKRMMVAIINDGVQNRIEAAS